MGEDFKLHDIVATFNGKVVGKLQDITYVIDKKQDIEYELSQAEEDDCK